MKKQTSNYRKRLLSAVLAALLLTFLMTGLFSKPFPAQAAARKLNVTDWSMNVNQTFTLKLSGVSGGNVQWKSSNSSIASVSKGKVTANRPGTVKITASYAKKRWSCTVRVLGMDLEYNDFYRDSSAGGNFIDAWYASDSDIYYVLYNGRSNYNRGVCVGDDMKYLFESYGENDVAEAGEDNLFADEFSEAELAPVYVTGYSYIDEETGAQFCKTFFLDEDGRIALIVWWCNQ